MINYIVDSLLDAYIRYEMRKIEKKSKKYRREILPNYVKNRRIKIINNGIVVFDSNDVETIPKDIQYTIKSYGIPKNIKPNNKTPLIYNVNTTLSSMFQTKEIEERCFESIDKVI